jgi:branched-chain amino acid aminotransferase
MSHAFVEDERNASVRVYMNGALVPRAEAVVSVLDSGFMLGDGLWESLRVKGNRAAFLGAHLDRLFEGCAALDLALGMDRDGVRAAIRQTVAANAPSDHLHLRLMITRGLRSTPYQSPRVALGGPTVVILPEYKAVSVARPLDLFTVHVRRGNPDVQDPGLNSHSKLNCILACIQAEKAGADEALMLDPRGFVSTCNSTHFFVVRKGEVWTSTGAYCLPGITRANVLRICRREGLVARECDFSLRQVYSADEVFVTGTFGGLTPVRMVDGRAIANAPGPMTERLLGLYKELWESEAEVL